MASRYTERNRQLFSLFFTIILKWGYDSERGQESIRRMNAIHGHYPISDEDFLYVLSTFIYEPIRWNERFGWRLFSETEKLAIFYFWQAIGQKMYIRGLPSTYDEFAQFNQNYEQQHFVYSDSNRCVAESTINLFLSWFPRFSRPLLEPCVHAMFDELTLTAFGLSNPPAILRNLIENSLRLHGYVSRWLLPRRKPDFFTDSKLRSYPHGYKLKDLGPTKMLSELNRLPKRE